MKGILACVVCKAGNSNNDLLDQSGVGPVQMKEVQRLSVYEDYGVVTKRKDIHMKHDYTDVECCSETCIHQDLVKIVNDTMPDETELYGVWRFHKNPYSLRSLRGGGVRVRSGGDAAYDTVGNLPPAAHFKAE